MFPYQNAKGIFPNFRTLDDPLQERCGGLRPASRVAAKGPAMSVGLIRFGKALYGPASFAFWLCDVVLFVSLSLSTKKTNKINNDHNTIRTAPPTAGITSANRSSRHNHNIQLFTAPQTTNRVIPTLCW